MLRRIVLLVASSVLACNVDGSYTSVSGEELQKCSGPGMALTGFTRTGKCVAHDDDAGSHHVCIDMSSNAGGNFCQVTGYVSHPDPSISCQAAFVLTLATATTGSRTGVLQKWDAMVAVVSALLSIGVYASGHLPGTSRRLEAAIKSKRSCATRPT